MSECKWYVLRAVSGQEKKVKTYLDTEIARQNLSEEIAEVLIPTEKVLEVRNGKKKQREKTFFPGYILIKADLNHGEAKHLITSIPGVLGFLSGTMDNSKNSLKEPIPLREAEVNRILGRIDESELAGDKLETSFTKGETIKVIDGPFNGFDGTVEEIFDERKKLNVTVKIFGRSTPVELNFTQVEKQF